MFKGWYPEAVDFENENNNLSIPPYILGIWLGDGTNDSPSITKPYGPVSIAFEQYAKSIGCKISDISGKNSTCEVWNLSKDTATENLFRKELKNLNLIKNKHIPNQYKITSQQNRLELLAGLLDTDGIS